MFWFINSSNFHLNILNCITIRNESFNIDVDIFENDSYNLCQSNIDYPHFSSSCSNFPDNLITDLYYKIYGTSVHFLLIHSRFRRVQIIMIIILTSFRHAWNICKGTLRNQISINLYIINIFCVRINEICYLWQLFYKQSGSKVIG